MGEGERIFIGASDRGIARQELVFRALLSFVHDEQFYRDLLLESVSGSIDLRQV